MISKTLSNGRPKTKGPLMNLKLRQDVHDFLRSEAGEDRKTGNRGRTGKSLTLYIEQAIACVKRLKPSVRDQEMSTALRD